MTRKVETMDLKGKEYAKVPTRIKQFREDCPNGLIETTPELKEDNVVLFRARVLKDKSNPESAEATGHAIGKLSGEKSFEKLETIAVGRALAMLGYMASGEIASSEEMERFNEFQNQELEKCRLEIQEIATLEELKKYFLANQGKGKELVAYITERKKQLTTKA